MKLLSNIGGVIVRFGCWLAGQHNAPEPQSEPPPAELEFIGLDHKRHTGQPVRAVGLHLLINAPAGEHVQQQLIGEWQAIDRRDYWRAWKARGGAEMQLQTEDGTSYDPAEGI